MPGTGEGRVLGHRDGIHSESWTRLSKAVICPPCCCFYHCYHGAGHHGPEDRSSPAPKETGLPPPLASRESWRFCGGAGGSGGKRLAGNEWGWWLTARPSDPELLIQGQRASALLMTELSLTGHHGIMQDQTRLSLP